MAIAATAHAIGDERERAAGVAAGRARGGREQERSRPSNAPVDASRTPCMSPKRWRGSRSRHRRITPVDRRRRRRQPRPVRFTRQHRRQDVRDVVARKCAGPVSISYSTRRTPTRRRADRRPCPSPAPATCRRRCRGSCPSAVMRAVIVGEFDIAPLARSPLRRSSAFARPKSSTFTVPSAAHLDVGRLQIAMDDALLVRRFERVGDLPRDRQRLVERHRSPRAMIARAGRRPRRAP